MQLRYNHIDEVILRKEGGRTIEPGCIPRAPAAEGGPGCLMCVFSLLFSLEIKVRLNEIYSKVVYKLEMLESFSF